MHERICIDDSRDIIDALDHVLGHDIPGGRFAADDDGPRHQVVAVAAANAVIQVYGVQHVQQLALVLMDALDLHIEQHVGRNGQPCLALEVVCKPDLVGELDGAP